MNCCNCGKELTEFEALVMADVPDNAWCYDCSMNQKREEEEQ